MDNSENPENPDNPDNPLKDKCDPAEYGADAMEVLPCQQKCRLAGEDEISVDSILSFLMPKDEPSAIQYQDLKWDLKAKDFYNEKQSMIFPEKLYISQLHVNDCKLTEESKIFLESELEEIGEFNFRVEESYDGYVVFGKSHMVKDKTNFSCGHWIRGKYDDKLRLICERRGEYDYVDSAKIERKLDARVIDDKIVARRESRINNESQHFKTVMNIKGRDDIFILDGGVLLLIRYLIVNNFRGDFHYYTMNLFGKVLRCVLTVHKERKDVKVFHRCFSNAIRVVNTQYFNDFPQEVSETFLTARGRVILFYWHGFRYVLHETKGAVKAIEPVLPKLELMWRSHNQVLDRYRLKRKLTYENAKNYLDKHGEVVDFLMDLILTIVKHKPQNVLEFAVKYFQKFR